MAVKTILMLVYVNIIMRFSFYSKFLVLAPAFMESRPSDHKLFSFLLTYT